VLLLELCQSAPTVGSGSFYARIVLEHSYRRRVQRAAVRLLQGVGHLPLADLADLVTREHQGIAAQQRRANAATPTHTLTPATTPTSAVSAPAAVSAPPRALPPAAVPHPTASAASRPRSAGGR